MKRRLFFIINSIFLITAIGIGTQSCSDDDDDKKPDVGKKTIELKVFDDKGVSAIADVTVWKNQDSIAVIQVNGTYSYDVTNEANNTEFQFQARRPGYISSGKASVTLEYKDAKDTWSYPLTLTITEQSASFVVDQSEDGTISFSSHVDPSRDISIFIPAHATDLEYLEISPTLLQTPVTTGFLLLDAPNKAPSVTILSIESDWEETFNDGKMATLTFPLTEGFVKAVTQYGLSIGFGTADNKTKIWESYPVTIDPNALTGTVSIPHFSTWYLTISEPIEIKISNSPVMTLGTSACGEPITVTYSQPNPDINQTYIDLLGLRPLSSVTQSYTALAVPNMQVTVQGYCEKAEVSIPGTDVSFVYYQPPIVFTTTTATCGSHSGGGGQ